MPPKSRPMATRDAFRRNLNKLVERGWYSHREAMEMRAGLQRRHRRKRKA